jgi:hypothetical protein
MTAAIPAMIVGVRAESGVSRGEVPGLYEHQGV